MGTLAIPAPFLPIPTDGSLQVECETGKVSDGYHTFDELYSHRFLLYLAFMREYGGWKSRTHWIDGELQPVWDGWFLAGIQLPQGQISYHIPVKYWDLCPGEAREAAPEWDGHTSADVLHRLACWVAG